MSFRDRIAARVQESQVQSVPAIKTEAEPEIFETPVRSPFYGIENIRNHPSCLELRLADGSFIALPYAYFVELSYNSSNGIQIISSTRKIYITGRNLQELYSYLISYRIKYVQANVGHDLADEKSLFVRGIKVEDL